MSNRGGMRKLHLIAGLVLALAAAPGVFAQAGVLPDHFGKWTKSPANLQAGNDGTPVSQRIDLSKETGETKPEIAEYTAEGASIRTVVRKFSDPTGAYEAYTAEINLGMLPSSVGGPSAIDADRLLLLIGNLLLEIRQPQSPSTDELKELAVQVQKHSDPAPLPPIRAYLPPGFSDGTQKYARGPAAFRNALSTLRQEEFAIFADLAGFNSSAEAMFAHYRAGKNEAVLLLIEYPTPQLAEQHLRHLEQAIPPAAKQAGTTIERKASLLSLVLKPTSQAYADSLRKAVSYETAVTWNEPHQTVTDPPLLTTLSKIFIGTGIFMVVAVVLGVAFGGVRVLAKVFFPGKFFDRPEQMDVLQLGLSGKRIDSRDFY